MTDQIDLSAVVYHGSPNVSQWSPTVQLQGIEFKPGPLNGIRPIFDRAQMNARWPDVQVWFKSKGDPEDGFIQFCLWAFVPINGVWHGAALHEFWSDRKGPPRIWTGAALLENGIHGRNNWQENWCYRSDVYGEMTQWLPVAGNEMAFMLTAGDVRNPQHVLSVPERTNVVKVPIAASGVVVDEAPAAPIVPTPGPSVPTPGTPGEDWRDAVLTLSKTVDSVLTTTARLVDLVEKQDAQIAELKASVGALVIETQQLRQRKIPTSAVLDVFGRKVTVPLK